MVIFRGQATQQQYPQDARAADSTLDQPPNILAHMRFVQLTDPPHRIKYNTDFLAKYHNLEAYGQPCLASQDIILTQRNEDLDNKETILPPSTPIAHSLAKKARMDDTDEDMYQTTLTQQWQRTTMTQMPEIDHTDVAFTGDQEDNTVNSMDN
jgi:hypothetical protein